MLYHYCRRADFAAIVTMLNVGSMHYDLPWLMQLLFTEELARRRLLLDSEQDQIFDIVREQVKPFPEGVTVFIPHL